MTYVELVIGAPPPYHKPEYRKEWGRERDLDWYHKSHRWAQKAFPDAFFVYSALHGDETSAHAHIGLLTQFPKDAAGNLKLSWSANIEQAARTAPNAPARPGRRAYRLLLESYEHHVGRHFDLVPGKSPPPGEEAVVEPPNTLKAWEARAALAKQKAEENEKLAEENEKLAEENEKLAQDAMVRRQTLLGEVNRLHARIAALNSAEVQAVVDQALAKIGQGRPRSR